MDNNPIRVVKVNVEVPQLSGKLLSQQGEHLATELQYYLPTEWLNPEYTYRAKFKLPNGDIKYADLEYGEKFLVFRVPQALTLLSGILESQLTIYKESVVAKCYVAYFKIQQSINVPQEVEDKYVGLLEDTVAKLINSKPSEVKEYIYFKKNCQDWSEPRIYFFNNHSGGEFIGVEYDTAFRWEDSPYMLYDEDSDCYYYPLMRGYDSVIFYCNKMDNDGWNFKTNVCHIPPSSWCTTPLFVQSRIGFDGFWADYTTNTAKLIVQHNPHYSYINPPVDTKISDVSCVLGDGSTKSLLPEDLGIFKVLGNGAEQRSHYEYFEFPIEAKYLKFTFKEYASNGYGGKDLIFNEQVEVDIRDVCYIYPVMYLYGVLFSNDSNVKGTLCGFNAANDRVLFPVLFNDRSHNLILKDTDWIKGQISYLDTNFSLEHHTEYGGNDYFNRYYTYCPWDGSVLYSTLDARISRYVKTGNLVCIAFDYSGLDMNKWKWETNAKGEVTQACELEYILPYYCSAISNYDLGGGLTIRISGSGITIIFSYPSLKYVPGGSGGSVTLSYITDLTP